MALQKPKETRRLKYLYVLLGRITGIDEYKFEGLDTETEVTEFNRVFDNLYEKAGASDSNKKAFFTLESVLTGNLTIEDKQYSSTPNKIPKTLIVPHKGDIPIKKETLLHRAISFLGFKGGKHDKELYDIIFKLVEKLPFLLKYDRRQTEYDGQTPLHLAVLKEDITVVNRITTKQNEVDYTLDQVAKGDKFKDTVMMAGTPLCVAALKFNKPIFKILSEKGANIAATNPGLDNVCHSLIRFAHTRPESLENARDMLEFILKRDEHTQPSDDVDKLLMMENKEGLNPLQLATKLRLHTLFMQLYESEVYCEQNVRDCLRDDQWFDITEIETLPVATTFANNDDSSNSSHTATEEKTPRYNGKQDHASILPAILLQRPQSAISFLEFPAVQQVIEQKWNHYRRFLAVLGILHFVFMIVLTHSATERAQLTNDPFRNPSESLSDPPKYKYRVGENGYVSAVCAIGFTYGLMCLLIETKRIIASYKRKVIKQTRLLTFIKLSHSNLIYRWLFILLSVFLILDFILAIARIERYANYLLIAVEIVGWYLLLFFIQMIKPFSFFTSLIQTVMIDLIRFFVVMVTFLIGFTTAMYMAMQGANTDDDTFQHYDSALMKMFTIMLGLGEIDSLFLAREPAVVVLIFIIFVLLSTILLLNALLAIMANTCSSLLSRYGNVTGLALHYRLQTLSAILMIEDVLPVHLQKEVGVVRERKRFIGDRWYPAINRRMLHDTSLASDVVEEKYLPGIDTIISYITGRHDTKTIEHTDKHMHTDNKDETDNAKNGTTRKDTRVHPYPSIHIKGVNSDSEMEVSVDLESGKLNVTSKDTYHMPKADDTYRKTNAS